jgi:hypothetical protein
VQANIYDVSLRYVLNIDIERAVLCVEKRTFVAFLSYRLDFESCKCEFHVSNSPEMKFEVPSEMETGTARSCRSVKLTKKLQAF